MKYLKKLTILGCIGLFTIGLNCEHELLGNLMVRSDPQGAEIFLDDSTTGETTDALIRDRVAGVYELKLVLDGYEDWVGFVEIKADTTVEIDADLDQLTGALEVKSLPEGAAIWLDSDSTGHLTNHLFSDLTPGSHTVRLTFDGYQDWDTTVNVVSDTTIVVEVDYSIINRLPVTPNTPIGPSETVLGGLCEFAVSTTDPDGDQVSFKFDWGDGDTSDWSGLVNSGATYSDTHTFATEGTWPIKVMARDENQATSEWSIAHIIEVKQAYYYFFDDFNDDPLGGNPDWDNIVESENGSVIISNTHYGESGYSCSISDPDSTSVARINIEVEEKQMASITFVWRIEQTGFFGFRTWDKDYSGSFRDWLSMYIVFDDGNRGNPGYICSAIGGSGIPLTPFTPGQWYKMRIDFDQSTRTYDVYVDGELKGEGMTFYGSLAEHVNVIEFIGFSDRTAGQVYVDDVGLYTLDETSFNSYNNGLNTATWPTPSYDEFEDHTSSSE